MADDRVTIWSEVLKAHRAPASGELMVGNGEDFTLSSLSDVLNLAFPASTQGSIIYKGASGWTYLGPGTAGQLLQTGGASANPSWATGYSPPSIANNTIVSNVSGSSAAPAANTLTQVLDSVAGSAQGSILYRSGSAWTVLAPGTAGQVLQTNGASANPSWDGPITVFKTSDQTITSTAAYTDVTSLSFSVSANTNYTFSFVVYCVAGAGGILLAVNGPASPTALTVGASGTVGQTTYDAVIGTLTGAATLVTALNGYIKNGSNAGTLTLRFRQNASNAADTTIRAGSYLRYFQGP